ncbi:hypothetical protein [Romboutsia sp. MSSM.1001216sp_RTP31141st1_F12_RTP31141_220114]
MNRDFIELLLVAFTIKIFLIYIMFQVICLIVKIYDKKQKQ